ncbi:MAG: metallophosphoesterase, partial [Burkholderiales bacterium]
MGDLGGLHTGYDIIGDVHGCSNTLEKLLCKLGYELSDGVYRHPSRRAIFVGDVLDRGPHIREALHLVKAMVDSGSAECILGNHEFNAIGYTTRAPVGAGQSHVRAHTPRHNRLIAETLEQFASYPEEWRMFLE